MTAPDLTVVVPTFNEAPNVAELVRQVADALDGVDAEVLFVDDSRDDTPDVIREVAATATIPVRLIHRDEPVGGLSGAVQAGLADSAAPWCVVMDGDLQHPPALIPALLATARAEDADVVVASRYTSDGSAGGLANATRRMVSSVSTSVTRAMFPVRLADCSDPMTGFFAVRREAVDLGRLQPRGFKILLEILARHRLRVAEIPFVFGERFAGESKASFAQGMRFLAQLAALRFGRMSRFAIIGGFGALVNIALVALLTGFGLPYLAAAIVAAEITIVMNFLLQERFVFADLRHEGRSTARRFAGSFAFNNVETAVRMPLLVLLVSSAHIAAVPATAVTLLVAFVARFVFHARVVYRPRSRRVPVDALEDVGVLPDEASSGT
ncbi:glycosyltransferase family 2 protein [Cellulomonas sp. JH27-2]|uniref:glycosyltransferase n=1 Tax=Cellulomonas sp. JH27-2 TaxID=2774139 RepID=UPI00177D3B4C|nr:glycosyltransferase family 2 protein [Cellulomonas sp. JH27-2]